MTRGGCLCGTVTWATTDELTPLSHCHCSMCRKAHAAPFASFTSCAMDTFEWTSGAENLVFYASSPEWTRAFCGTCGSAMPDKVPGEDRMSLPAGGIVGDPGLRGGHHIFVGSKAPWHVIADDLERHDTWPGDPDPVAAPPPGEPSASVRGSCLCGQVQFALSETFKVVHNCHCSLCRRARGAAHTTNGFVGLQGITFLSGADQITQYNVPGSKVGQAFCARCGSGTARVSAARGVVNVPLGALDDVPDHGPDNHIFTTAGAPWYEITDDLPRFDEGPQ